jgi:hypothetical protein
MGAGCHHAKDQSSNEPGSPKSSELFSLHRMREFRIILLVAMAVLMLGCADAPVEYNADNAGGTFHSISTDPVEIFRSKVDHEAGLEARGVEPPVGQGSWREYWTKVIAYYTGLGADGIGTRQQVAAYIAQQRSARGLPPL